ncbi:hypothetical protein Pst134EA_007502 [Puccinia striiformis f. sp. tritici]|uniref:hypothetical protein n=1 Tax=Puccinia striiformis f. sp. tritici TaxID=168172 RepID=UPI002008E539|nr:hypothetical protein Pst134EA_007502 [Puccinia striiformis f. sp. tritici]KAH9470237.1 hypothetical protein Pst134EA_007502 [Puccinia striiformis f. sp. tritici]
MGSAQMKSFAKAHKEVAIILTSISCRLTGGPAEAELDEEALSYAALIRWAEGLKPF